MWILIGAGFGLGILTTIGFIVVVNIVFEKLDKEQEDLHDTY